MEDDRFSDVTLVSDDGKHFPCHRSVLAVSSPVFNAMFTTEMAEKKQSEIQICWINGDTLSKMIEFIYTGELSHLPAKKSTDFVKDLFLAADMYALDRLKASCQLVLIQAISTENVCDLLVFAEMSNCGVLHKIALRFIGDNGSAVFQTKEWNRLIRHCADMADKRLQRQLQQQLGELSLHSGSKSENSSVQGNSSDK